jgi:hypothetical protein
MRARKRWSPDKSAQIEWLRKLRLKLLIFDAVSAVGSAGPLIHPSAQ